MNITGTKGDIISVSGENLYDSPDSFIHLKSEDLVYQVSPISGSFSEDSHFKFQIPTLLQGSYSVSFRNSVRSTELADFNFIYIGPPKIDSLLPVSGVWRELVDISGENFIHVSGVYVGESLVKKFEVVSKNLIKITIPDESETGEIKIFATGGVGFSTGDHRHLLVSEPNTVVRKIAPAVCRYGGEISLSGESLHRINKIHFVGIEENKTIVDFSTINTTGIITSVPTGSMSNKKIILEYSIGSSPSEFSMSSEPLLVSNKYISSFSPDFGIYNDVISVSGNGFNGASFFFEGFNTGDKTYIPASSIDIIDDQRAKITVPKNIIKGFIYVSGNSLEKSREKFTPYPSILGISQNNLQIGGTFILTGANISEIYPAIFLSESSGQAVRVISNKKIPNLYQTFSSASDPRQAQRYFGELYENNSELLVNYPESVKTGNAKLSGIINGSYVGNGKAFLVHQEEASFSSTFKDSEDYCSLLTYFNLSFPTGKEGLENISKSIKISGKQPTILGISASQVEETGSLFISGLYLMDITGLKLSKDSIKSTISVNEFESMDYDLKFKTEDPGPEKNLYESVHTIKINIEDFHYSGRSGSFYPLAPYYS